MEHYEWVEWKMSENERALASELNEFERNEWVLRNEWTRGATLWDEAEIIWGEADGSIYYTTGVCKLI